MRKRGAVGHDFWCNEWNSSLGNHYRYYYYYYSYNYHHCALLPYEFCNIIYIWYAHVRLCGSVSLLLFSRYRNRMWRQCGGGVGGNGLWCWHSAQDSDMYQAYLSCYVVLTRNSTPCHVILIIRLVMLSFFFLGFRWDEYNLSAWEQQMFYY